MLVAPPNVRIHISIAEFHLDEECGAVIPHTFTNTEDFDDVLMPWIANLLDGSDFVVDIVYVHAWDHLDHFTCVTLEKESVYKATEFTGYDLGSGHFGCDLTLYQSSSDSCAHLVYCSKTPPSSFQRVFAPFK
jgi:hypothetical protein